MKIAVLSVGLLALCGATALPAIAAKPGPKPKLTMAQARIIALKRAPGKIKDAEYEQEKGGWRYSFDIVQANRIHEIGVDAMTGAIVEDIYEAPGAKD